MLKDFNIAMINPGILPHVWGIIKLLCRGNNMKIQRIFFLIILVATSMTLSCATLKTRNPLPQDLSPGALVLGSDRIRMWGDRPPRYVEDLVKLQPAKLKDQFPALFNSAHNYLAISGGGANGAFGAGLLFGWTEKGDRPEFSQDTDHTYYQVMFETPDKILIEVVYGGLLKKE